MGERLTGSSYNQGDRFWYVPALFLLPPALLITFSGILGLYLDGSDEVAQPCRAVAAILLLLSGTVQLFQVRRVHQSASSVRACYRRRVLQNLRSVLGWFAVGVLGSYLGALAIGPTPGIVWLLMATLSVWYTTMMWCVVAPERVFDGLNAFARRRLVRTALRVGGIVMAVLLFAEVGLRLYALAGSDRLTASFVVRRMVPSPGSEVFGHTINSQGFAGAEFQLARTPGVCRIAVIGDELAVSGCERSNCLRMLDQRLPGVEIYNFGLPAAGPREYTAVFVDRVARYEPDLVLCFISVGDDISDSTARSGHFDWRNLQLGQLADRACGSSPGVATDAACRRLRPESQGDYLRRRGRQLTVCQTPMTPDMRGHWEQLQTHLDRLAGECRAHKMPLGIVLIPGAFQTNEVLLSTLCCRMGVATDAIDVELPQRRLLLLSQQHDLPTLDLLPSLRDTGAAAFCHNQNQLSRRGNALVADSLEAWAARRYGTQFAGLTRRLAPLTAEVVTGKLRR